jgi:organic hydroperoxide reductase OsmC/OhrA
MTDKARALHGEIGALCFIARSVNFPVRHEPTVRAAPSR